MTVSKDKYLEDDPKKQWTLKFWINFLIFATLSTDLLYSNFKLKLNTRNSNLSPLNLQKIPINILFFEQ